MIYMYLMTYVYDRFPNCNILISKKNGIIKMKFFSRCIHLRVRYMVSSLLKNHKYFLEHLSLCIFSAAVGTSGKRPMSFLKIILASSGIPYISLIVLYVSSQRGSTLAGIMNLIVRSCSKHSSSTHDIAATSNDVNKSIGRISISTGLISSIIGIGGDSGRSIGISGTSSRNV